MNIFTALYEKLFVPKDVRKLCEAYRAGKLHLIGYSFSKRSESNSLCDYANISISADINSKNWIKIWNDGDVMVIKNDMEADTANIPSYRRLLKVVYAEHLAKQKATRLERKKALAAQVNADIHEIFADILKD